MLPQRPGAVIACDCGKKKFLYNVVDIAKNLLGNSTLSDYIITIFPDRHSGMDCRNPGSMDGFEITIHGTGYPNPGGYDGLDHNLTK